MKIFEILTEKAIPVISKQQAIDRGYFGPCWHGSMYHDDIMANGFDVNKSRPSGIDYMNRPDGTSNGFALENYGSTGYPPPIHFLGHATYFTTIKSIATRFNGGTTKGLKEFYINTKNIETINFGSTNTMMKWWRQNGYDPKSETIQKKDFKDWLRATDNLTNTLKSKCDAVWFKGKGMHRLLDGDQIAVFDPSLIVMVDPKLASGLDIGAKVKHNQKIVHWIGRNDVFVDDVKEDQRYIGWKAIFRDMDGRTVPLVYIPPPNMIGTIVSKSPIKPGFEKFHGDAKYFVTVKWAKGGTHSNYYESELEPTSK